MNFGNLVKTAFDATPSGQRLQQTKVSEQEQQQKQEQNERDFADYVQSRGARPVQNGMVHRDWTSGNGSVIPNAIFDKAGNEGRQVITHKDPLTGEKIQWELGTPDEQIAHQTALKLHQQMSEAPIRATTAQEATQNAGATMGAQTTARLGAEQTAQNTEREARGLTLPEVTAKILGLPQDQQGRKYLPAELDPLTAAASNIQASGNQNLIAQENLKTKQEGEAVQQLSGIADNGTQEAYDQIRKTNPAGTAKWPAMYSPASARGILKSSLPLTDQLKMGLTHLADVPPDALEKKVDEVIPPSGRDFDLNSQTKALVRSRMLNNDPQGAQKVIEDAATAYNKTQAEAPTETQLAMKVAKGNDKDATSTERAQGRVAEMALKRLDQSKLASKPTNVFNMPVAGTTEAPSTLAQMVGNYQMDITKAITARTPPAEREKFLNQVKAVNPDWQEQHYANFQKTEQDAATGKIGTQAGALNVMMGHLDVLDQAVDALKNNDIKAMNRIANFIGGQTGSTALGTYQTIVHRLGPEITKAYVAGGGSAGERGANEEDFDANLSPDVLKRNIGISAVLANSKIEQLNHQYQQGTFGHGKQQLLTPTAESARQRLAGNAPANLQGGTVKMKAPDGTVRTVNAADVEHYKAKGATVVP